MNQQNLSRVHLDPARKYRVVQWCTGNIGTRALRAVIEHPKMTLVGVYVHSEAKAGRDAGELCGLGPVGVTATRDIDEIIALKPDCVLYMQEGFNFDDVCKLLASGANIVTTRWEVNNPADLDPAVRKRVEEACRRGGTSIHGTGSMPGFITTVPLVLMMMERRLDSLTIVEFADLSSRNSPQMLFDVMDFGKPPDIAKNRMLPFVREIHSHSLSVIADAISMPLDTFEVSGEFATARHKTSIAAGVIEAGTVAAQRITVSGMRGGRPLLTIQDVWYCTTDFDHSWGDLRHNGWHVSLEGDTPMDVDIRFPVPLEKYPEVSPNFTAHPPVNAIPFVCAAPPGILRWVDLPYITADLEGAI